jgi:aspartyl/asparaginyl-tRNA synthetase
MHTRNFSLSCFACVIFMFTFVSPVLARPLNVAPPVAVTPLAQITAADEGKQVTVQAIVVGTENFSDGFKLTINDATAQAILLIWADDWDYVDNNYRLNVGAVVSTTGKVDVYRNQIEIVPDRGRDVQVIKWAKRDWRKYDLGAINGNDHNAVVWVEGTIADIQSSADSTCLLVRDATGVQKVRLYDVVAGRVPHREKLRAGQSVSVVGRVRAKRRVGVEIVVALPQDVYIPVSAK